MTFQPHKCSDAKPDVILGVLRTLGGFHEPRVVDALDAFLYRPQAIALRQEFRQLFSPGELRIAERRLADHGYQV